MKERLAIWRIRARNWRWRVFGYHSEPLVEAVHDAVLGACIRPSQYGRRRLAEAVDVLGELLARTPDSHPYRRELEGLVSDLDGLFDGGGEIALNLVEYTRITGTRHSVPLGPDNWPSERVPLPRL